MNVPYLKEKLFNRRVTSEDIQEIFNTFNIELFRNDNILAKKIVDGKSLTKFFRLHVNRKEKMIKIGIIVILLVLLSKLYINLFDFINLTFYNKDLDIDLRIFHIPGKPDDYDPTPDDLPALIDEIGKIMVSEKLLEEDIVSKLYMLDYNAPLTNFAYTTEIEPDIIKGYPLVFQDSFGKGYNVDEKKLNDDPLFKFLVGIPKEVKIFVFQDQKLFDKISSIKEKEDIARKEKEKKEIIRKKKIEAEVKEALLKRKEEEEKAAREAEKELLSLLDDETTVEDETTVKKKPKKKKKKKKTIAGKNDDTESITSETITQVSELSDLSDASVTEESFEEELSEEDLFYKKLSETMDNFGITDGEVVIDDIPGLIALRDDITCGFLIRKLKIIFETNFSDLCFLALTGGLAVKIVTGTYETQDIDIKIFPNEINDFIQGNTLDEQLLFAKCEEIFLKFFEIINEEMFLQQLEKELNIQYRKNGIPITSEIFLKKMETSGMNIIKLAIQQTVNNDINKSNLDFKFRTRYGLLNKKMVAYIDASYFKESDKGFLFNPSIMSINNKFKIPYFSDYTYNYNFFDQDGNKLTTKILCKCYSPILMHQEKSLLLNSYKLINLLYEKILLLYGDEYLKRLGLISITFPEKAMRWENQSKNLLEYLSKNFKSIGRKKINYIKSLVLNDEILNYIISGEQIINENNFIPHVLDTLKERNLLTNEGKIEIKRKLNPEATAFVPPITLHPTNQFPGFVTDNDYPSLPAAGGTKSYIGGNKKNTKKKKSLRKNKKRKTIRKKYKR